MFQFPDSLGVTEQKLSHSEKDHEVEYVEPEALDHLTALYDIRECTEAKLFVFKLKSFFLDFQKLFLKSRYLVFFETTSYRLAISILFHSEIIIAFLSWLK